MSLVLGNITGAKTAYIQVMETATKSSLALTRFSVNEAYQWNVSGMEFIINIREGPAPFVEVDLLVRNPISGLKDKNEHMGYSRVHPRFCKYDESSPDAFHCNELYEEFDITKIRAGKQDYCLEFLTSALDDEEDWEDGDFTRTELTLSDLEDTVEDITGGVLYAQRLSLKQHYQALEEAWEARAEFAFSSKDVAFLQQHVIPLLRRLLNETIASTQKALDAPSTRVCVEKTSTDDKPVEQTLTTTSMEDEDAKTEDLATHGSVDYMAHEWRQHSVEGAV